MPSATEVPSLPCPCGAADYALAARGVSHRNVPNYAYALYRCQGCALVRTWPLPDTATYGHGDAATRARIEQEEAYRVFARAILDDCHRYGPTGRFLDVGCNIGLVVEEAQRRGYEAWGLDLDPVAVAYGQSRGRRLLLGTIEAFEAPPGGFDLVVANHVLEHVEDPRAFVAALHARLRPGGYLFVNVPNLAGWVPTLMKANWGALWPHQHVWQFTPETLQALVERAAPFAAVARDTSHNLEPPSTADLKGWLKRGVVALSVAAHRADELRMVFRKP